MHGVADACTHYSAVHPFACWLRSLGVVWPSPFAKRARSVPACPVCLQGVTATVAAAALGETYRHPYNLGMYANLDDIFGPHAACWLAPPCRPADGGTRYPTVYDDKALGLGL